MTSKTKKLAVIANEQLNELTAKPKPITPYQRLKDQYTLLERELGSAKASLEFETTRNRANLQALEVAKAMVNSEVAKRSTVEGRIDSVRHVLQKAASNTLVKFLFPSIAAHINSLLSWWTVGRLSTYASLDKDLSRFITNINAKIPVDFSNLPAGHIQGLASINPTPADVQANEAKNAATPNPYDTAPYRKR